MWARLKVLLLVRKAVSEQLGACLVLRVIFEAGLARQESLGSFKRKDLPEEPERSTFGSSCARYDAAGDRLSVTFTGNDF